jgi:RNA polymerase sigma-70 factor (ECF subfamily)
MEQGISSVTGRGPTPAELDVLTQHVAWVRRLAHELVRDPASADDLAQEACLAALQGRRYAAERGEQRGSLRQWLATVVRNGARQDWRRAERRTEREHASARSEAQPSTAELIERVAMHRTVVDALLALDEPYRGTLLQRYFEDLSPTAIAARTDVPVATVKTRLQRGLARLRETLGGADSQASDSKGPGSDGSGESRRSALLHALAPLLVDHPTATVPAALAVGTPLVGFFAVSTITKFALVAVALAGGFVALWEGHEPLETPTGPVASDQTARTSDPVALADGAPLATTRTSATAPTSVMRVDSGATSTPGVAPAPETRRTFDVRGRALGAHAEVAPGAALLFEPSDGSAPIEFESDRAGAFVLRGLSVGGRIDASGERYVTLFAALVSASHDDAELVVVVAPRVTLGGRVIDVAGRPIADALVQVRAPEGFRARFEHVMDYSGGLDVAVRTDDEGRFVLAAPALTDGELVATHERFIEARRPLPLADQPELRLELERPALDARTLVGIVLDAGSQPVAGARVAFGVHGTSSDADGTFRIDLDDNESPNRMASRMGLEPLRVVAAKAGHLPALLELARDQASGQAVLPASIVLRLGGPPLEIVGRVVDPAGSPVVGAAVWARDATVLEFGRGGGLSVEAVLDGRESNWEPTSTDDDGRFVLTGLVDVNYVVAAHDPETLLRVERDVRAGSASVTLVMDSTQLWRRVAGKVVDRGGRPIPGVRVRPMTDTFFMRYQGRVVGTSHAGQSRGTETDEEGRFELENMPRELVYLRIDGEDVVSDDWGRRTEGGIAALSDGRVEELNVVVRLRVHMQVHLADPSEADAVRVLTAEGTPIVINLIQAGARREQQVMPLVGGRSEVLTVDDSSATLVLEREGEEVRRVPLALQRGQLNRVDA